jgi:hypothetical protein
VPFHTLGDLVNLTLPYRGHRIGRKLLILGSATGQLRNEMALMLLNLTIPCCP